MPDPCPLPVRSCWRMTSSRTPASSATTRTKASTSARRVPGGGDSPSLSAQFRALRLRWTGGASLSLRAQFCTLRLGRAGRVSLGLSAYFGALRRGTGGVLLVLCAQNCELWRAGPYGPGPGGGARRGGGLQGFLTANAGFGWWVAGFGQQVKVSDNRLRSRTADSGF